MKLATKQYNIFRFLRRFIFAFCYKSFFCPSSVSVKLLRLCGVPCKVIRKEEIVK